MIKIRKAKLKDIPQMVELWLELMNYHTKLDPYFYQMNKNAVPSWKKFITKNIKSRNADFFVAEDNGKIVGYMGGEIEKRPPCFIIENNGYVIEAIITKNYRKKGVGKKLMKEMLNWFKAKKMEFVQLRTYSANKDTVKSWERMGFKENLKLMIKHL